MSWRDYARVLATFWHNALIREMSLRGHFWMTAITRGFWFAAQMLLFQIIYGQVAEINTWSRYEFYAFMATGMIINSITETFFLPNCAAFAEAIRTGNLDFILLKPMDTQFLVSFDKIDVSSLSQLLFSVSLLGISLWNLGLPFGPLEVFFYLLLLGASIAFLYSLMITLAALSVWFGRNQGLYDFWFYVTIFARYPRDIYRGGHIWGGEVLYAVFSYVVPILLVVTVPVQVLIQKVLSPSWLVLLMPALSLGALLVSRGIFQFALRNYRSAGG